MTDYTKLVEDLRRGVGYWYMQNSSRLVSILGEAADAIEALQKTLKAVQTNSGINFRMWEEAQAEVERLKDSNEELREKQTFIDHYGTEWMTSAKDVPTAAYKHGYADGMAEVKAQLPKRGEIVRCRECRWVHICRIGQHLGLDGFCSKGEREVQDG